MAALRTARPVIDHAPPAAQAGRRPGPPRRLAGWVSVVLVGVVGCSGGRSGTEPGPSPEALLYRSAPGQLPPPSPERIVFKNGALSFYELPASGRWMVQVTGADAPSHVGPAHFLPEGINPESTYVSYCRPGGQTSQRVTLAEIKAAGRYHDSGVQ